MVVVVVFGVVGAAVEIEYLLQVNIHQTGTCPSSNQSLLYSINKYDQMIFYHLSVLIRLAFSQRKATTHQTFKGRSVDWRDDHSTHFWRRLHLL